MGQLAWTGPSYRLIRLEAVAKEIMWEELHQVAKIVETLYLLGA